MDKDLIIPVNMVCDHHVNAGFSFETGNEKKTFTWCRRCGAVLIPNLPEFVGHFRNQKMQTAVDPSGQTLPEFLWVLPDRYIAG